MVSLCVGETGWTRICAGKSRALPASTSIDRAVYYQQQTERQTDRRRHRQTEDNDGVKGHWTGHKRATTPMTTQVDINHGQTVRVNVSRLLSVARPTQRHFTQTIALSVLAAS